MLLVKTCTSVVLFNYRQHIFLLQFFFGIKRIGLLMLFSFRKEETSQAYQFLEYGRKNTKYQKKPVKVSRLTIYIWKSINVRRD